MTGSCSGFSLKDESPAKSHNHIKNGGGSEMKRRGISLPNPETLSVLNKSLLNKGWCFKINNAWQEYQNMGLSLDPNIEKSKAISIGRSLPSALQPQNVG